MTGVDPHGARTPQDIPDLTLAEFLLARLDEDAQVAQDASTDGDQWRSEYQHVSRVGSSRWQGRVFDEVKVAEVAQADYAAAEHIARHDPARVLRDVAAKRAIVEQCAGVLAEFDRRDTWGAWPDFGPKHLAEDVLAQLVEVYADHPDYRPEWRP